MPKGTYTYVSTGPKGHGCKGYVCIALVYCNTMAKVSVTFTHILEAPNSLPRLVEQFGLFFCSRQHQLTIEITLIAELAKILLSIKPYASCQTMRVEGKSHLTFPDFRLMHMAYSLGQLSGRPDDNVEPKKTSARLAKEIDPDRQGKLVFQVPLSQFKWLDSITHSPSLPQ
ncbi:hypothetical protein VNO77_37324 [Canavalia gladiata]|uniref:Uncharacterized protein n=1 Tax=Canavalia gladiata TaxID=3824 RepID=A0AAN9KAE6_CANGL